MFLLDPERRRQLAPQAQYIGLNISTAQFPRSEWLPASVKLLKCDVLNPAGPPSEVIGKFDVGHARYMLSLIRDTPKQLIESCTALLIPGGCFQ